MNVQRESSPSSLPVTIATLTKVKSKMATSIKLKVLSLSDTTRVQLPSEFFVKSSLTDSSFYMWVESRAFESRAEHTTDGSGSGEKLTGSKTFRWYPAHISVTDSYRKHKHTVDAAFVQQSGSLSHCVMWWTTSCPVLFRSHSARVPRMWLWVLKIYRCEFGYRMRLSCPKITVLCVNVTVLRTQI